MSSTSPPLLSLCKITHFPYRLVSSRPVYNWNLRAARAQAISRKCLVYSVRIKFYCPESPQKRIFLVRIRYASGVNLHVRCWSMKLWMIAPRRAPSTGCSIQWRIPCDIQANKHNPTLFDVPRFPWPGLRFTSFKWQGELYSREARRKSRLDKSRT